MTESTPKKVNIFVKIFVLFHAFMIFAWSLPDLPPERQQVVKESEGKGVANPVDWVLMRNRETIKNWDNPMSLYLVSTGLWQSWNMFAPNPASTDVWMDAVVTYADGSEDIQKFPRMYELPIPEKYVKERFRKYRENLTDDGYGYKWPHTSYRMALEAYRRTGKEPARIVLRRHFMEIAPEGKEQPKEYKVYDFYETAIDFDYMMEMSKK